MAEEEQPPAGESPICWLLLTTLAVSDMAAARQSLLWYSYRWLVERYHFVLKSGCRIEELQLERADRLQRALATYTIVAWRLLWLPMKPGSIQNTQLRASSSQRNGKRCTARFIRLPDLRPLLLAWESVCVGLPNSEAFGVGVGTSPLALRPCDEGCSGCMTLLQHSSWYPHLHHPYSKSLLLVNPYST